MGVVSLSIERQLPRPEAGRRGTAIRYRRDAGSAGRLTSAALRGTRPDAADSCKSGGAAYYPGAGRGRQRAGPDVFPRQSATSHQLDVNMEHLEGGNLW